MFPVKTKVLFPVKTKVLPIRRRNWRAPKVNWKLRVQVCYKSFKDFQFSNIL